MLMVILARVTASNTNQGPASATPALKEWAAIVHALLEGEQIVDVRKGGIREDGRHFDVATKRCWLSPTAEHQKAELLKPAYAHWVDLADASPVGQAVTLQGWADIVDIATITEPEHVDALDSKLVWSRDYVESRFNWKRRDPLWVLVMRVHRLAEPLTVTLERRLRRLHVMGRLCRTARRPGEPSVGSGALRRCVRGQAQGHPRSPPPGVLEHRVAVARAHRAVERCGRYPRLRASASVCGEIAMNRSDSSTASTASVTSGSTP